MEKAMKAIVVAEGINDGFAEDLKRFLVMDGVEVQPDGERLARIEITGVQWQDVTTKLQTNQDLFVAVVHPGPGEPPVKIKGSGFNAALETRLNPPGLAIALGTPKRIRRQPRPLVLG